MSLKKRSRNPLSGLKRRVAGLSLFVFALSMSLGGSSQAAIVERIVAVVGQRAILLTDIQERALPIMLRIYSQVPEGPQRAAAVSQLYQAVLKKMVDEELEETAASKAGVSVSPTEIDEALARVASQNDLTVNEILSEAKRSGMAVDAYREELRRQLLQAKMGQLRLSARVHVTESDLRSAYKRLQMQERMQTTQRTLRLRVFGGTGEQEQIAQKKLADSLADRAEAGEDFRELIQKYATRAGSGLSPPVPPLQEPKNIQRATMALEVGEISRPVKDGADWVILQVIERPPSQLPPYQDVRTEVQQQVYMEKMTTAREHWLDGLRRRTHVDIRL